MKYSCSHGGKANKSKSKGERQNQSKAKIGCPFVMRLKAAKDRQALEVTAVLPQLNCEVTEMEFKFHPRVQKVDPETEKEIASHLQLNASRKLVQQNYREKTGKTILLFLLSRLELGGGQKEQSSMLLDCPKDHRKKMMGAQTQNQGREDAQFLQRIPRIFPSSRTVAPLPKIPIAIKWTFNS